jgi:signal transduction histidine kinase
MEPATDWLRAALAWPELLLVGFVGLQLTRAHHPAARSWWMLSAMLLAYAVAQNLWAIFAQLIYSRGVPFPSLADLFYLLQYPFFFLAIILLPGTPSWGSRTKVVVDTLLWMGAVTALSWFFILSPLYTRGGESPLGKFVSLAYPVGDLAVLFGLTMALMRSSHGRADRLALNVLVVAAVCLIFADSWYAALQIHSTTVQQTTYAPNFVWIAAYLLVVLAGLVQLRLLGREAAPPRLTRAEVAERGPGAVHESSPQQLEREDIIGSLRVLVPFLAALLASATIMVHAALTYTDLQSFIGPLVVSLGLLLLAVVRQEITLLDNSRARREREADRAHVLALHEANRRMEEFLDIAGHELKTPLTSLRGNTEFAVRCLHGARLQGADVGDLVRLVCKVQAVLERSTVSVHRIGRLVDDLLDVVRIREGRLELRREPCDLAYIVREAVDDEQAIADARTILLVLPATNPVPVLGDDERLEQVVMNYVTNALKYSAEDCPVAVRLEVEGAMARVSVRDEGPGLPAGTQAQVWERFRRIEGIAVQSGSGVGLGMGLHISKSIVEGHHGRVGVESAPGRGSTFWFTLPLADEARILGPEQR